MARFFDQYSKFYETSETTPGPKRLNFRHHLIIEQNEALLKGKNVIEIASHDGRWAFAAMKAGAKSIYGIEPRQRLVDNANASFASYGIPSGDYKFACEDGYAETEKLHQQGKKFETAMILGFLYHTARPYEIIHRMAQLGCSSIIIDTGVLRNVTEAIVRFGMEETASESNLFSPGKTVDVTGVPSLMAIHYMLRGAGYIPRVIVPTRPTPAQECDDYRNGSRFAIVGTK